MPLPKPNDSDHGPQFRLTRGVAGKSVTEQHEVGEFHRFQKRGEDLMSMNERIRAPRPVESSGKKRLLLSLRKLRGK